MEAFLINC